RPRTVAKRGRKSMGGFRLAEAGLVMKESRSLQANRSSTPEPVLALTRPQACHQRGPHPRSSPFSILISPGPLRTGASITGGFLDQIRSTKSEIRNTFEARMFKTCGMKHRWEN